MYKIHTYISWCCCYFDILGSNPCQFSFSRLVRSCSGRHLAIKKKNCNNPNILSDGISVSTTRFPSFKFHPIHPPVHPSPSVPLDIRKEKGMRERQRHLSLVANTRGSTPSRTLFFFHNCKKNCKCQKSCVVGFFSLYSGFLSAFMPPCEWERGNYAGSTWRGSMCGWMCFF